MDGVNPVHIVVGVFWGMFRGTVGIVGLTPLEFFAILAGALLLAFVVQVLGAFRGGRKWSIYDREDSTG